MTQDASAPQQDSEGIKRLLQELEQARKAVAQRERALQERVDTYLRKEEALRLRELAIGKSLQALQQEQSRLDQLRETIAPKIKEAETLRADARADLSIARSERLDASDKLITAMRLKQQAENTRSEYETQYKVFCKERETLALKEAELNRRITNDSNRLKDVERTLRGRELGLRTTEARLRQAESRVFDKLAEIADVEFENTSLHRQCSELSKRSAMSEESVKRLELTLKRLRHLHVSGEEPSSAKSPTPLENQLILPWLCLNARTWQRVLGTRISLIGDGPFQRQHLKAALGRCGVASMTCPSAVGAVIVGRHGWEDHALDAQIERCAGRTLRVYSQELAMLSLVFGKDVFQILDDKLLTALGSGHPALDYLMKTWLKWPSTEVPEQDARIISDAGWIEEGLLKHLGYCVGHHGKTTCVRKRLLRKAFEATLALPRAAHFDAEYLQRWGGPRSRRRLQQIAVSIATFIRMRSARSVRHRYRLAILHWRADLNWLKTTLYFPSMAFKWPTTRVPGVSR